MCRSEADVLRAAGRGRPPTPGEQNCGAVHVTFCEESQLFCMMLPLQA